MLGELALVAYESYHVHHLAGFVVVGLIERLLQGLQGHQLAHLLIANERINADGVEIDIYLQVVDPAGHLPDGYLSGALGEGVGKEGAEERHIVVVVVEDGLVLDIAVDHIAAAVEMETVLEAGQLVALISVEEFVAGVGSFLGYFYFQAVEIAFLRTETGIEEDAVVVQILRHYGLIVGDQPVEFVLGHIDKFQRQHLGVEKDIFLLTDVPVKARHIHLVVPTRFDKERLAVVLYLQHHQGGIVGVGLQLEIMVIANGGLVHQLFGAGEHIGVVVEVDLFAGAVHHLAMNSNIGLGRSHPGQQQKQDQIHQF